MRYLLTLALSVFSFCFTFAIGDGGCGTIRPADYKLSTSEMERSSGYANVSRSGFRYCGVSYHIVNKTNGTAGASLKTVLETHCELNIGFAPAEIYFYIVSIDTINDDALWAMTTNQGEVDYYLGHSAAQAYNIDHSVNVYITGQLPGLCGFSPMPGYQSGAIFLAKDCCGKNTKTIPHEAGHFFNLDHTFSTNNGVEYVDGTNCVFAGDGFCDTPADASENRAPCPYSGTAVDPHGDLYHPDETLFMSYFSDNCLHRFSNQEMNEMNSTLTGTISWLLNQPMPDITPLDSVVFISPTYADSNAIGSAINFKWQSVPRAQYYFLKLQLASSGLVLVDTLLTDTFFNAGGLQANKSYKYSVRAASYGNVCESYAPYHYIQTSLIKATINVASPSCPGETDASISVTPSNGFPPYTVAWSNNQTGTTVSNLSPGTYTVTITDNNGKVATATVLVTDPAPVAVSIDKIGSNLNAYGNGGTPPYFYIWSNGVNGQFNNNVASGSYEVTVTDSRGCTTTEAFVVSSTGVDLATKVSMKVFPNPASKVSSLNLQIDLNERAEGMVTLTNVNGEVLQQLKKEFASGTNNVPLNIEHLSSGVYFLQFRSNETVKTERISVIR